MLRLGRELQKNYQKSRGWEAKLVASDAPHGIKYRGIAKAARLPRAHICFSLQSRASDLAGGKGLVDTVQFVGYCDLHSQASHPAGPMEAWAARPARRISLGPAAAGHRIFKQRI